MDNNRKYILPLTIFGLLILSFFYILNGEFIGDDLRRIQFNSELFSLRRVLTGELSDRPVLMVIIFIVGKFFGSQIWAFRLVGLIIHTLAAWQLYLLTLDINKKSENKNKELIAAAIAILFALHPIHNQMIATSIQMGVSLAGLFGLLSIRYFIKAVENFNSKDLMVSIGSFAVGILCKPILGFLPFVYLFAAKKMKANTATKILVFLSYLAILFIPAIFYFYMGKNSQAGYYTPGQYFLTQMEVWFTYFRLMIFPVNLHFLYDFTVPESMMSPLHWGFLLVHLLILFGIYKFFKRRELFFVALCMYLSFLPEGGFFPINHVAFEHRIYFPLIFVSLFFGILLIQKINTVKQVKIMGVVSGALLVAYMGLNQIRNSEVKEYKSWLKNTINHAVNYNYSNFENNYILAKNGENVFVKESVEKYQKLFPERRYEILGEMNLYFEQKKNLTVEEKLAYRDKFIKYLDDYDLPAFARYFAIKLLMEEYVRDKESSVDDLVAIAKTMSYQLKIISKNMLYLPFLEQYLILIDYLLVEPQVKRLKEIDFEYYYLAKGTKIFYYYQTVPGFKEELQDAIIKHPNSAVIKDVYSKLSE